MQYDHTPTKDIEVDLQKMEENHTDIKNRIVSLLDKLTEIEVETKKMKIDHGNINDKITSLLNELTSIETKYGIASNELKKRGVRHDED